MIRLRDLTTGNASAPPLFMSVKRYRYDDIIEVLEEFLYLQYRKTA